MELVTILRVLWSRRLWVSAGALFAVVIGMMVAFRISLIPPGLESRQYHIGQASVLVLVDTPSSQVADLQPPVGADVLGARSNLFANLMATGEVQVLIAKKAGIRVDELQTIAPSTKTALVPTRIARDAVRTGGPASVYRLNVSIDAPPIMSIDAEAPDAAAAEHLADSSVAALREYLERVATIQQIPPRRRAVVTALGRAASADVVRGPRRLFAIIATMFVFGLACTGIVIATGLVRGWRAAAELEEADESHGRRRRVVLEAGEPEPMRSEQTRAAADPAFGHSNGAAVGGAAPDAEPSPAFAEPEPVSSAVRKS
jgi:hypothetical protein